MDKLPIPFIRDVVIPEIERSGGATVLLPTTGNMPPALLLADSAQPPTWVVGIDGYEFINPSDRVIADCVNTLMEAMTPSPYTAVGFWTNDGHLYIDSVEVYTLRPMAVEVARLHGQDAIYNLQTGEVEWMSGVSIPA